MSLIEIPKTLYYFLMLFSKKHNYKNMSEEDIESYNYSLNYYFSNEVIIDTDIRILKKERRSNNDVDDYLYVLLLVRSKGYYCLFQENIV